MLLWSLTSLAIDLFEHRLVFRDFWQDWLIASGAIAFCLIAGRFLAVPVGAQVDAPLVIQIAITILLPHGDATGRLDRSQTRPK